jgi:molecular chaperone Hsp33
MAGCALARCSTPFPQELLEVRSDALLTRLFHEDGVSGTGKQAAELCLLLLPGAGGGDAVSLGEAEAVAAVADGEARVRCEFCGQTYRFDERQIATLFAKASVELDAPDQVQ